MKARKPGGRERPSRIASTALRTCSAPDCATRLSVYNAKDRCWQHTEINFPNYRGRRLARGET